MRWHKCAYCREIAGPDFFFISHFFSSKIFALWTSGPKTMIFYCGEKILWWEKSDFVTFSRLLTMGEKKKVSPAQQDIFFHVPNNYNKLLKKAAFYAVIIWNCTAANIDWYKRAQLHLSGHVACAITSGALNDKWRELIDLRAIITLHMYK